MLDWQPWSMMLPTRGLGANKSLAHKSHFSAKHQVQRVNSFHVPICWYNCTKKNSIERFQKSEMMKDIDKEK